MKSQTLMRARVLARYRAGALSSSEKPPRFLAYGNFR